MVSGEILRSFIIFFSKAKKIYFMHTQTYTQSEEGSSGIRGEPQATQGPSQSPGLHIAALQGTVAGAAVGSSLFLPFHLVNKYDSERPGNQTLF